MTKLKKQNTLSLQEYELWMEKLKIKVYFAELYDDFILLKIVNFHKYVGSLVAKITKCNQTKISKRQGA